MIMNTNEKISRKKFMQMCGSGVAGAGILVITGILLRRMYGAKNDNCTRDDIQSAANLKCSKCKISSCPLRKGLTI
ncbi:MAG: hypothetical protein ACK5IQ_09260 [Bacteroidales bacterium]